MNRDRSTESIREFLAGALALRSKLLKENHVGVVPHGFRSSLRDWAVEKTGYHRDVIEAALAHQVEAAYFRTDLLDKRRELMQDWADYLVPGPC